MRRSDEGRVLSRFARSTLRIVIAFGLAVGGLYLAIWAFEADHLVLGWLCLALAASGFLWLVIANLFYGGGIDGGDDGESWLTLFLLGGVVIGGGAFAVMGFGLIWLGFLAGAIAVIWMLFSWGSDLFG